MLESLTFGLAKTDSVDDRSVIECIADDTVLVCEKSFKQTGVCVEATWVQDGVVSLVEGRECCLELFVLVLGTADETDGGHTEAMGIDHVLGCFGDSRMVGES